MDNLASKRILRDIELLRKNKDALEEEGIYFHVRENNIYKLDVLIIPKHKSGDGLESPYTSGFFVFEITFTNRFPIEPPSIAFHPQQNAFRLHPNYYQTGKVCLSVINTWGQPDWSPSTSIMALLHILEERFTERALCFEPGHEASANEKLQAYNETVEYGKYVHAIIPIVMKRHYIYEPFQEMIQKHFKENFQYYEQRLTEKLIPRYQGKTLVSPAYSVKVVADYEGILGKLRTLHDDRSQGNHSAA